MLIYFFFRFLKLYLKRTKRFQVDHIKLILKKLKKIENRPLELYSLLQLINSSLPGVTATVEDSVSNFRVRVLVEVIIMERHSIKFRSPSAQLKVKEKKIISQNRPKSLFFIDRHLCSTSILN